VTLSGLPELDGDDLESAPESFEAVPSAAFHQPQDPNQPTIQKTVVPGLIDKQRYKVTGEFARGGMGRILLAYDRVTGREVAIKELIGSQHVADPDPAGGKLGATGPTMMGGPSMLKDGAVNSESTQSPPPDEITVERFLREARITSRLEHPNIVPVYEIAQRKDGIWYYSMKFVRGVTLSKRLRDIGRNTQLDAKGKLAERLKLLGPFIDVCNAIAYAHSKGVIHRDLKPDNIMLGEFGETVILDWGLALVEGEDTKRATHILSSRTLKTPGRKTKSANDTLSSTSSRLTMAGSVLGTPSYMPPEQALGKLEEVDEISDVYALGAILYEILSGTRAYPGTDAYEILDAVVAGPPAPIATTTPEVPPELVAVVEKAMARERSQRFQQTSLLSNELQAWRDGRAVASYKYSTGEQIARIVKRHRAVVMTTAAAMLVLLIGGALALWSINAEKNEAERHATEATRQAKEAREARQLSDERLAEVNRLEAEKAGRFARLRQTRIEEFTAATKRANTDFPLDSHVKVARDLLADWEKSGRPEPTPAVRQQNLSVSAALLKAIESHEAALELARLPIDGQSPGVFSENPEIDAEVFGTRAAKLDEARLLAIGVARANGDFGLARHLLGWARKMGLDSAKADGEAEEIDAAQGALLSKRRSRIEFAIEDAKAGLSRENRQKEAPRLEDYAFELAGYRDDQTVQMLGATLLTYAKSAGWIEGGTPKFPSEASNSGGTPSLADDGKSNGGPKERPLQTPWPISWSQADRDVITLCCRVLGRLELGEAAVKALTPFSEVVIDHELAVECGKALGATLVIEAWSPLLQLERRVGSGSGTGRALKDSFRRLPLSLERLGPNPDIDRLQLFGNAMYVKDDFETAIALFTRAIEMCSKEDKKLMASLLASRGMLRGMRREDGDSVAAMADLNLSIDMDNSSSQSYNSRGLARTGLKDYQGAIEDYNRALDLFGKPSANILTNRSVSRWELGDREGAMNDLADAIAADSQHSTARARRAQFRLIKEDYEGAIEDATRAIALEPHSHWAFFLRGQAKVEFQDYAGAIEDLSRSLSLYQRRPEAHFQRAIARASSKDLTGALADVEDGAKLDGNSNLARQYRAKILENMGKFAEAQAEWDAIIDSKPKELAAYLSLRGMFHARNKNPKQALLDANKAVDMEPENVEFLTDRLEVYLRIDHEFDVVEECNRILKLDVSDLGAHNTLANYYKEKKEHDKAFEHYGRMLAIDPRQPAALHNRALLYVELGQLDLAIADYTKAIEVNPRSAVTWNARARAWHLKGKYAKAIADYSRAIELDDKVASYRHNRAAAHHSLKNYALALADYAKAIEMDSENAKLWDGRARVHAEMKNHADAISDLTQAIKLDVRNEEWWKNRGNTYVDMGDFDLAIADYTKAIGLNEKDATAYYGRARAYSGKDDHANALRDYDQAIFHDPKYVWAYNNRGAVKIELGDLKGALEDFQEAINLDNKHASAYNNRAQVFVKFGDYKSALVELDKVIDLEPEEDGWYQNRGRVYLDIGKFKDALKDFEQAVKLDPNAKNYSNRGVAYAKLEDNVRARKDLEEAVKLDPKSDNDWNNLSVVCVLLGDYPKALEASDQAIKIDERVAEYHYRRGRALRFLAKYADAIKSHDQALFLDKEHAYAYFERGLARFYNGQRAEGVKDLETAVSLDPSQAEHRDLLCRMFIGIGDPTAALRCAEAALAVDNTVALYHFHHGNALAHLNRPSDAIKSFDQAILLDPNHAKSYAERGRAYNNTSNFPAAIKDFADAENLGYTDPILAWYRGYAKVGLGDYDGAVTDLLSTIEQNPNHDNARRFLTIALSMVGEPKKALAHAKWCAEFKAGAFIQEFGATQVAKLEKLIALEPWLTKTPTTPEESILKTRAILGFSHSTKNPEATKQAAALLQSVITAWKDVPLSDSRHRDLAELAEELGNRYYATKVYPSAHSWQMLAHDRRQWLEDKSNTAYNAACSAALEAARIAAVEATPASPGTEPKKPVPADSPESPKYWIEKAFVALTASTDAGYANPAHATTDTDLTILRTDPRWKPLIDKMAANAAKAAESSSK